jgi:hypothetical protein
MPSENGDRPSLEARIAALEWEVRQLRAEIIRGRSSAESSRTAAAAPHVIEARFVPPEAQPVGTAAGEPPPIAVPSEPAMDLETLVGRYGMLGLATLLGLAAIGTFVSWAIAHGLLGPATRVVLGLIAAAGIAVAGIKLRPRSRSFSDSLLALSLAAVHVCAWAAGPSLNLVPAPLALAASAAASVALGAFALIEKDEPLWCVGFGGASVAPFVCSTGHGTAPMLAGYATAVLIVAGSALGSRRWFVAGRVFAAGAALFTFALAEMPVEQNAPLFAAGLPLVVAGFGVFPFANGEVLRPRLRTMGLLAALATMRLAASPPPWMRHTSVAIAVGVVGCAWLALLELADGEPAGRFLDGMGEMPEGPAAWMEGAILPAVFLVALAIALQTAPPFGVATAVLLLSASRRSGPLRDALAVSTWAAAMAATALATEHSPSLIVTSIAWASVLIVVLGLWIPTAAWTWTSRISLTAAALGALLLVSLRAPYAQLPFTTRESAASFAVFLAWTAVLFLARSAEDEASEKTARVGLVAFAFLWGHQELAYAISPTTSSLLLIGYYAVNSVAFVAWGRARGSAPLRRVGLALGIIAACLAVRGAWDLPSAGARIVAYLLVSGFLLGIAWWYRQPDDQPAAQP